MNLRPLGKKVIVDKILGEKTSSGGIVLTRSEEPDRAKVLAIGSEVDAVEVGDVVLLDWNKASKAQEHYVVSIDDIVFIYGE
jgi:co-chaperonin GroES (HSP10)